MTIAEKLIEKGKLDGIQIGMEKGKLEGLYEGEEKGIKKGIKKGEEKGKLDIALNMLAKDLDVQFIAEVTGLAESKIRELALQIQDQATKH